MFWWHKAFSKGRESVKDEPCSGRLSTSKTDENVEKVRTLVRLDRWITLRMINSELNLNRFTVHEILSMRKVCAKKLCQKISHRSKGQSKERVSGPPRSHREWSEFFQKCDNRWRNMDFRVWSWDETPKSRMAHNKVSAPQKSKNEQIKN